MRSVWLSLAMTAAVLVATKSAEAAHCGSVKYGCCPQSSCCDDQCSYVRYKKVYHTCYRDVEKTRKRRVWRTEYREVKRTCYKIVPETCYKTVKCTEYKTENRTCYKTVKETCYKDVKYTVCKPVTECTMKEETYTVCVPKTVYKPVTKEICEKTKVCEYLPPRKVETDECDKDCKNCCPKKGFLSMLGGLCKKSCCKSSCDKSCGRCEVTSKTAEAEGMWIRRPVTIKKTVTCMVPCTIMEKKECKRMVPCKTTRIVEVECTKRVPYTVCKKVPYEVCVRVPYTVCKRVPYTVCKKVPECVIEKVPYRVCDVVYEKYTCKVPYRVCTQVPVCKPCRRGGFLKGLFSKKCNPCCKSNCCEVVSEDAGSAEVELKPAPKK